MATPLDALDTIVVVMMENRSFDHVLGFLSYESFDGRGDIDGLHQHSDDFDWGNPDSEGRVYKPTATADSHVPMDLPHGRKEIAEQVDGGSMLGFMKSYFASQDHDRSPSAMRFCRPEDIPITAALARNYTVCDRWFASLPTDTFPNRLMSLSGYTNIDATSVVVPKKGKLLPDQTTIFDWLKKTNRKYEIYVDAEPIANLGPPASMLLMRGQWGNILSNAHTLDKLKQRWHDSRPPPSVIYCEPFFNDFATVLNLHGNCNHPPLPMAYGETFLRTVYTTLTSNPARWARTMLIICYDEHGGFFDHVPPPAMRYAPQPGAEWLDPAPFDTLGLRIPGIIVSPLVEHQSACHALLDHTSILQLMVDKFGSPDDLAFFGDASNRKASGIRSLAETITRTTPRPSEGVTLRPAPVPADPAPTSTRELTPGAQLFERLLAMKPKAQLDRR